MRGKFSLLVMSFLVFSQVMAADPYDPYNYSDPYTGYGYEVTVTPIPTGTPTPTPTATPTPTPTPTPDDIFLPPGPEDTPGYDENPREVCEEHAYKVYEQCLEIAGFTTQAIFDCEKDLHTTLLTCYCEEPDGTLTIDCSDSCALALERCLIGVNYDVYACIYGSTDPATCGALLREGVRNCNLGWRNCVNPPFVPGPPIL